MQTTELTRGHREGGVETALAPQRRNGTVRRVASPATARPSGSATRRGVTNFVLLVTAALVATTGAIHLHLWAAGYRSIPTIGPLFLFQGIAGVAIAVALAATRRLRAVAAAAGFMIATIGGLLLSVYVGLFGFSDNFAAPFAGVSLAVELAGVVASLAGGLLLLNRR